MIGNSPSSTPMTPLPDPPASPGEGDGTEPVRAPASAREGNELTGPESASADDLGLLLSDPDPFLSDEAAPDLQPGPRDGGRDPLDLQDLPASPADAPIRADEGGLATPLSSENELVLPVKFSPCPDLLTRSTSDSVASEPSAPAHPQPTELEADERRRTSWWQILVASYASAVTLALIWILLTGRGLRPRNPAPEPSDPAGQLELRRPGPSRPGRPAPPLPARNVAALGTVIRVGDLEVEARSVTRRSVDLVRLDGFTGETRQVEGVLVLSLVLANRSADQPLHPLEPSFVRDSSQADDQSFLETADGRRISTLHLATESEWSVADQHFPTLQPGEAAETIVVSEPVQPGDLSGTLTWHVKLRTGTYQTDVLGVRFTAADVRD